MEKINWINGQSGGTPLSAENLNLMQDNAENAINEVATNIEQLKADLEPVILWEGDLGEAGKSATLIDDYTEYEKIIILGQWQGRYCSTFIYPDSQSNGSLEARFFNNSYMYHYKCYFEFSGTTLNLVSGAGLVNGSSGGVSGAFTGSCQMSINKIIGYNKKGA